MQNYTRISLNKFLNRETVRMRRDLSSLFKSIYSDILNLHGVPHKTPHVAIAEELNFPWSGLTYSERLRGNMSEYSDKVDNIIQAINQGESLENIFDKIDKVNTRSIDRHTLLQRVEQEHMVNMASVHAYKKMGIKHVIWYTRRDELVCPVCGKLHRKEFSVGRIPKIPQHPNCRCRIVPIQK